jgi:cell division protein FtsB
MFSFLRLCSRMAATAVTAATMMSTMSAQSATDSVKSPLELAIRQNNLLFGAYMVLLVLVLIFTYLLWRSGNSVQEAIRKDADARIEEAKSTAAQADARSKKLENDNLTLTGTVAELQTDAAKQQERAAIAERALLELQERLAHRRIGPSQHAKLVALLQPFAGSTVTLTKLGDSEAGAFADDIISVLTDARWHISLTIAGMISPPAYGLRCSINEQSQAGKALAMAMRGLPTATIKSEPSLPIAAKLVVGLKPPP